MNRFLLCLTAVLAAGCATAPDATSLERRELAPTGVLRVAVFTGNPVIGSPDPVYGEPTGTTALLGRELAAQAGVPARIIEYTAAAKMTEDTGAWDVAAASCGSQSSGQFEFAPPHMIVGERFAPTTEMCLVLPKGRTVARNYVAGFVARAKSQGTVARAIADAGLRGVSVAP